MRNDKDSGIEERLIEDALAEYMGRVEPKRDLWPEVRDRLSQRSRSSFSIRVRIITATAVVLLLATLVVLRPWSFFEETMSPFAAVAHAYDGLFELETIQYRINGTNSTGNEFEEHHQLDMVNRIGFWVLHAELPKISDSDPGHTLQQEFLIINGIQYERPSVTTIPGFVPEESASETSNGGWRLFSTDIKRQPKKDYAWVPFGEFGGLPWSRENAEESFDNVELVGDTEVDGQPVVHYRATSEFVPDETDLDPVVYYMDGKRLETVPSGVESYPTVIETVDLWVTEDGERIIKADWMHIERGSPLPADYEDRDWCEGLGEFTTPEYFYRSTSQSPNVQMPFRYPIDSEFHQLAGVTCWNKEETEGRIVWGRNSREQLGEDFWVRWVYTFTAFNEPLDLPTDLPE